MRFLLPFLFAASVHAAEQPNIVLIMADDIGLGDLSHHVRTQMKKEPVVETPTLDALARQSLWFTDGHSATALCSPTRYCMMSGNNNYRSNAPWGVWSTFGESAFKEGDATLGSVVHDAGYTTGFIGKWHLGGDFKNLKSGGIYRGNKEGNIFGQVDLTKFLGGGPKDSGFDYDFTVPCGIQGPTYTVYENETWFPLSKDSKLIYLDKTNALFPKDLSSKGPGIGDSAWNAKELGKLISEKAVNFINTNAGKKPFFLYYCTHAVHVPHCPPDEFDGKKILGATPSHHLDMVVELDMQVKRIVDALKANGVYDNTLLVFTSDNGGLKVDKNTAKSGHDVAGGFAGSKNSPLEGGHRVPFFAVWKGRITPGVTAEPAINQDMLATLAALVGTTYPTDQAQDSNNLLPLLTGQGKFQQREFMIQQAGSKKEVLYRKAPWKLIIQSNNALSEFTPKALYNLEENPQEKSKGNMIKSPEHKEIIDRMLKEYLQIFNSRQRTVPLPAPAYNPEGSHLKIELGEAPRSAKFESEDKSIWGGSLVKGDDGLYHMFYSRWPKDIGWSWVTDSEVCHAVSKTPYGPWKFRDIALPRRGKQFWDGWCTHNPTVHKFDGKYYIYHMGNTGAGEIIGYPGKHIINWQHRNKQRIGVAVADNPNGPWKRFDKPLIDVDPDKDGHDSLVTSNPSICRRPDGGYLMVYKAVGQKYPMPNGGPVVHCIATSDSPTGPFVKHDTPTFLVPGERFPAEDPYIWHQDGKYRAIVKRIQTPKGKPRLFSLVHYDSVDGFEWSKGKHFEISDLKITWEGGEVQQVVHLERPQVLVENGVPIALACASDTKDERKARMSFNVQIPLKVTVEQN